MIVQRSGLYAAITSSQNHCPTDDERWFHVNGVDFLKENKLAIYT